MKQGKKRSVDDIEPYEDVYAYVCMYVCMYPFDKGTWTVDKLFSSLLFSFSLF